MASHLIVSTTWATVLSSTETTGAVFGPVGSGRFQVSYQDMASGVSVNLQHLIDGEWVETGDSISSADLAANGDGTSSGAWVFRLRHGDEYRFTASAAGPTVKMSLMIKASGF